MNFYRRKLLNAILYLVKERKKLRRSTPLTALAKLLCEFDFRHFKETGEPAIGLRYFAYPNGPLPFEFWLEVNDGRVPDDFKSKLNITITRDEIDQSQRTVEFLAVSDPDMGVFSPRESRILTTILEIYGKATTRELVDASHERGSPWDKTKKSKGDKKEIDYIAGLDGVSTLTSEEAQEALDEFFAVIKNFRLSPTN